MNEIYYIYMNVIYIYVNAIYIYECNLYIYTLSYVKWFSIPIEAFKPVYI